MLSSMGDAQLSASSLAGQFINLFQICCMGLGMGASVLTARFWGMQEKESLRKSVTLMLRLCLLFAGVFTLFTGVRARPGYAAVYRRRPNYRVRHFVPQLAIAHVLLYGAVADVHHCAAQRGASQSCRLSAPSRPFYQRLFQLDFHFR